MIHPPTLIGGAIGRWVALIGGLFLVSFGIVALLETELGLSPWDMLSQGVSEHTPLSFGMSNVAVSAVVLLLALVLGARIGAGTVANAVLVGVFIDLIGAFDLPVDGDSSFVWRLVVGALGILVFAVGSAFYIGAAFGAGPRDSLMLVLARRTSTRIGMVRVVLEASVAGLGLLLGATAGLGTIAFVLLVGPALEVAFAILVRLGLATPAAADAPAHA